MIYVMIGIYTKTNGPGMVSSSALSSLDVYTPQ